MSKKNIAAVLFSVLLIVLCVVSPWMISGLQNQNLIGKMKFDKKETVHQKKKEQTLLEKIEIYKNEQSEKIEALEKEQRFESEIPGDIREKDVMEIVEKEWSELYQKGLLATPPNQDCLKNIRYYVRTYMNSYDEFVTVLEVYAGSEDDSECFDVIIEKESGKIIQLYHYQKENYQKCLLQNNYLEQYGDDRKGLVYGISEIYGDYLNVETVVARIVSAEQEEEFEWIEGNVRYHDKEIDVAYTVSIYENELIIAIQ